MLDGAIEDNDSLFSSIPELKQTPPEKIVVPSDFMDVTARLLSEDGRIKKLENLHELMLFRDEDYRNRTVTFHCDLTASVEMTCTKRD